MSFRSNSAPALALFLLCTQSATPAHVAAAAANVQTTRQAFVVAMRRIRDRLPETPDSPELGAYAIHDYLVAARYRRDLTDKADALDTAIEAFLQARSRQPVTRALKHEWLASLARRQLWDRFLPRSTDVTDPILICERFEGRLATGDTEGLGAAVLERWSLPQKQPPECDQAFAWLKRQNLLTPALAEARTRAALAADNPHLAREFALDVPGPEAVALLQWSDLLESPRSALAVLAAHPGFSVEPEAIAAGFEKLARGDSPDALDLLPLLLSRSGLTPPLQVRLQRAAALGAAYDHDSRALAAFDGLPADSLDNTSEEWRVRAELWAGHYDRVLADIERMPASLATQPRWRYWRARAVAATKGTDDAAPLFEEIAGLRDYYGYLAADRLHRSYNLNVRPSPDDAKAQARIASDPGVIRAHELFACDMTDEANAEWSAALGDAEPAVKVQAAHLAARWEWYAQSIGTLAQAGEWDDVALRYPRPYPDVVAEAATLAGIPDDWIWAVMRQESLFREDAVSRADARGLMQMLPATAAAVARRWHLPHLHKDALFDPSVAIPLGAAYLRELLDRHSGQLALSLAAYNAGSAATARWLPANPMDADVWVENIPYAETRSYVQHIMEHIVAFAHVSATAPPRLDDLMPPVEPAAPAAASPTAPEL
ncbi:MAG: transglycosylase SLT domain-containing protein [Steroidobacteraceae bacterium]